MQLNLQEERPRLLHSKYFLECKTMFDVYDVTCLDPWKEHVLKPSKIWIIFKPNSGTRDFKNKFEASMIFNIDINKTISSDLLPERVLNTLKEIYKTSFIQQLLSKYKIRSIRIYDNNNALYSPNKLKEVKVYRDVLLKQGINTPPEEKWIHVGVEIKRENGNIDNYGFVYPVKTDLFIFGYGMLKKAIWYDNFLEHAQKYYTEGEKPNPEDFCIIMKRDGELNLILLTEKNF